MTHFYGQLKVFWGFYTIFSDCVLLLWGLGNTGRYLLPQWGSTEGCAGLRRVPQEGQGTLKEAVRCQGHHAEGQRKGRTIHINSECFLGFSSIIFAKNDACAKSFVFSVSLFSKLFCFVHKKYARKLNFRDPRIQVKYHLIVTKWKNSEKKNFGCHDNANYIW